MNNNLKKYRKTKRLTQQELADRIGISRPQLSKIERGIVGITKQVEKGLKKFDPAVDLSYIRAYSTDSEYTMHKNQMAWKNEKIQELKMEVLWMKKVIKNLSETVINNK